MHKERSPAPSKERRGGISWLPQFSFRPPFLKGGEGVGRDRGPQNIRRMFWGSRRPHGNGISFLQSFFLCACGLKEKSDQQVLVTTFLLPHCSACIQNKALPCYLHGRAFRVNSKFPQALRRRPWPWRQSPGRLGDSRPRYRHAQQEPSAPRL